MHGSRNWRVATVWRSKRNTRSSEFDKIYTGRVGLYRRWITEVDSIGAARRVHVGRITFPVGWHLLVLDEIDTDSETWVVSEVNRRHAVCKIGKTRERNDNS